MKRASVLLMVWCASTYALAQKAEVAVVVGETFTSNAKQAFQPILNPGDVSTINSSHHIYVQGAFTLRWTDAKMASLPYDNLCYARSQVEAVAYLTHFAVGERGFRFGTLFLRRRRRDEQGGAAVWRRSGFQDALASFSASRRGPRLSYRRP